MLTHSEAKKRVKSWLIQYKPNESLDILNIDRWMNQFEEYGTAMIFMKKFQLTQQVPTTAQSIFFAVKIRIVE